MGPRSIKWLEVQKSLGCISIEQVGISLQDKKLKFLVNASFKGAIVKIGLEGLHVGTAISLPVKPEFGLDGLSLSYQADVLEIAGRLIHTGSNEFDGTATIKTKIFSLSTLGAYGTYGANHDPYLFIFGFLDYKFGGSPAFFIEGLAIAFGYHVKLRQPSILEVADFPLVQSAISGPTTPTPFNQDTKPAQALEIFEQGNWIMPSLGDDFASIGVKFSSFKMIDSFVLLTINFGTEVTIHALGISEIKVPNATNHFIGYAQIALKAAILPQEGRASFTGQLSSASYIFSNSCHLTGGFAAYSWFGNNANSGDFVITLGGYNPSFLKPKHYPEVPKLGFNWKVSDAITIKGNTYFALTPNYAMAGGKLELTFNEGDLHAWLDAETNFLIAWQPFHYDITVGIDIGVSYTFTVIFSTTISVDVSADLHAWGPDFSGNLHVHLWIVSFTIDLNPHNPTPTKPKPLDWQHFSSLLLPSGSENFCGVRILKGLVKDVSKKAQNLPVTLDWIVNPAELVFETYSFIPSKSADFNGKPVPSNTINDFGIPSMAVESSNFSSIHHVTITSISAKTARNSDCSQDFEVNPISQNVAKALWDKDKKDDSITTLNNTLNGLRCITKIKKPDQTPKINIDILLEDNVLDLPAIIWPKPNIDTTDRFDHKHSQEVWLTSIIDKTVSQNRQGALAEILKNNFVVPTILSFSGISTKENKNYYVSPPILHTLGEEL